MDAEMFLCFLVRQLVTVIKSGLSQRSKLSSLIDLILSVPQILKDRRLQDSNSKRKERMCYRIDWVIVPVLNVDGYLHSWSKVGPNILHNLNQTFTFISSPVYPELLLHINYYPSTNRSYPLISITDSSYLKLLFHIDNQHADTLY